MENGCGHGIITNTGIKAGPYARVIINGDIVVDKLCGVIELLQVVLKVVREW